MSSPVDLTNLREITDGDAEMEQELFKEFIRTSDSYVASLEQTFDAGSSEEWRTTAHSFKGIALNLGANNLGELCKKAQDSHTVTSAEKEAIFNSIKLEYASVKNYLDSIMLG